MIFLQHNNRDHRPAIMLRLLILRSVAIAMALSVLLVFQFYLQRSLLYPLLYGVVFAAVVYTLVTLLRLRQATAVRDMELVLHLLADAVVVVLLVSFSGRATNPFIYYLLVLVAIASAIFLRWMAWLFALLAVATYTLLLYFDLAEHMHHLFSDFQLHLVGMWINFVASTALLTLFVSTMATALRDREVSLANEREKALQNEQLIAIGTQAATTVHALGTPLSTMAVVLGDMPATNPDVALLQGQVDRCKQTLSQLSHIAEKPLEPEVVSVAQLVDELQEHYHLYSPISVPEFKVPTAVAALQIRRTQRLNPAVINIIDNALRAAQQLVIVSADADEDFVRLLISDDGDGVPATQARHYGKLSADVSYKGLGIGVFLANTTVEQMGGRIVLHASSQMSAKTPRRGLQHTVVAIELPLLKGA